MDVQSDRDPIILKSQFTNSSLKLTVMITIEKKSLNVGKYVDTKHVDSAIKTYKKERWIHNSKRIGKEDSLSDL
jgi:hypothetical protein